MKVAVISLGCDKNTVDTEMMLGILDGAGHELVYDEADADAVVINTCAFILDAKKESIDSILRTGRLKSEGKLRYIIVAGCLGQRYTEEIGRDIPEIDAILGTQSFDEVAKVLDELACRDGEQAENKVKPGDNPLTVLGSLDEAPVAGRRRLLTTPTHYAYMKIAEGCDKCCSYCIIPKLRGRYRSVPMGTLKEEAVTLAARGVKELILVAQETTLYGTDIYGTKKLPELIRTLAATDGIEHIRLLYCYPEEITDELIELMLTEPKLWHYIDMPIQHASDDILRRMGRRTDEASLRKLIVGLRTRVPDICIRTTLISGFPGETHRDHVKLMRFVEDMCFDRLGVFAYSPEEGTAAARMKDRIPEFVKRRRRDAIMKLQQGIVFRANQSMTGRELDVVIEGRLSDEGVYVGRSYRDAPDVDGLIFIDGEAEYLSGESIRVRITGARGYDLIGVPV